MVTGMGEVAGMAVVVAVAEGLAVVTAIQEIAEEVILGIPLRLYIYLVRALKTEKQSAIH